MNDYKIRKEFSEKGINQVIKKLTTLSSKMPEVEKEFKRRSLDFLEKKAKYYIRISTGGSSWYQLTHTLENSFVKDYNLGELINICFYSAYVEFGTGTVGNGTHPMPKGYSYDVNAHGDNGWYFDVDGQIHFTKGMKAHRFMYNAVNEYVIGMEYKRIFDASFKSVMRGVLK